MTVVFRHHIPGPLVKIFINYRYCVEALEEGFPDTADRYGETYSTIQPVRVAMLYKRDATITWVLMFLCKCHASEIT